MPAAALVGQPVAHDAAVVPDSSNPNRSRLVVGTSNARQDSPSARGRSAPGDHRPPLDRAVALERAQHPRAVAQRLVHRRRGVQRQAAGLAQQQQTQRVVQLGVGEQHRLQRRGPVAVRVQGGEGLDLGADVGRGVDQEPPPAVGADRDRRLGARGGPAPERTAAHTGQPQFHCGEPPPAAEPSTRSHTLVLRR